MKDGFIPVLIALSIMTSLGLLIHSAYESREERIKNDICIRGSIYFKYYDHMLPLFVDGKPVPCQ